MSLKLIKNTYKNPIAIIMLSGESLPRDQEKRKEFHPDHFYPTLYWHFHLCSKGGNEMQKDQKQNKNDYE